MNMNSHLPSLHQCSSLLMLTFHPTHPQLFSRMLKYSEYVSHLQSVSTAGEVVVGDSRKYLKQSTMFNFVIVLKAILTILGTVVVLMKYLKSFQL